jgi:uncharacterized membrane protein
MIEDTRPIRPGASGIAAGIHRFLFPVPVVCFTGAMLTDTAYSESAFLMWLHFSEWLIAAGLAFGAIAALALLVEFVSSRAARSGAPGWWHLVLFYAALVAELLNALVHTIDGWTAVVPTGISLSIVGAVLALAAAAVLARAYVGHFAYQEVRP